MTPKQDSLGDGGAAKTPWLPGSVKPTRVGYYQVRAWMLKDREDTDTVQMAYWTGRHWAYYHTMTNFAVSKFEREQWRGLAADPKGANSHE